MQMLLIGKLIIEKKDKILEFLNNLIYIIGLSCSFDQRE